MKTLKKAFAFAACLALIGAFSLSSFAQSGGTLKEDIIDPPDENPAPLSMDEKDHFEELKIFKSGDELNISFKNDINGFVDIQVLDITGKIIYFSRENKDGTKLQMKASIGHLPSSIYIIKVGQGKDFTARKVYI